MTDSSNRAPIAARKSTPLSRRDLEDLQLIRKAPSFAGASEASVLREIVRRGMDTLIQEQMEAGYRQMAQAREGRTTERQAIARRRRPTWANEP